jgi:hypothetical protein
VATFSTNFDGSESPIAESGVTDNPGAFGSLKKVSGILVPVVADTDAAVRYDGATFGNDQFSRGTWGSSAFRDGLDYPGVCVRMSDTTGACYMVAWDAVGDTWTFYYVTDGGSLTFTPIGAAISGTFAGDDVIELRAVGTTLTAYRNSVSIGSRTDANLASGRPGISHYQGSPLSSTVGWTSWTCGDVPGTVLYPDRPLRTPAAVIAR